jgi:regulatory protein
MEHSENQKNANFQTCLEVLRRYCAFQERTVFDVKQKAVKLKMNSVQIEQAVKVLKEESFLDELRYVTSYAKGKIIYNQWGKMKIKMQLRAKGISQEMIDEVVSAIDNDMYFQVLKEVVEKKDVILRQRKEEDIRNKVFRYAMSKGFEYQDVLRVYNEI